jgi:hypothetical protein
MAPRCACTTLGAARATSVVLTRMLGPTYRRGGGDIKRPTCRCRRTTSESARWPATVALDPPGSTLCVRRLGDLRSRPIVTWVGQVESPEREATVRSVARWPDR